MANTPLILTSSNRLARWLMLEHDDRQKQKKVWQTPKILPLTAWLKQVWLDTWPEKYLLSKIQSEALWEKIISNDSNIKKTGLLHKKAAAKESYQAYRFIHEYQLPILRQDYQETLETVSFFQWMDRYEKKLQQWNALDSAQLMDFVSQSIRSKKITLPSSIQFKGFHNKTPQLQTLLNSIQQQETNLEFLDSSEDLLKKENCSLQKYDDKILEAQACARWIRKNYQQGKRFGIIVPELEKYRSLLNRELATELCPASILPERKISLPFNISQGSPLSQTTPISLILQILQSKTCKISAGIFYSILRSSVFQSDQNAALELEAKLRRERLIDIDLKKIRYRLNKENPLYKTINTWSEWALDNKPDLPSEWSKKISKTLQEINWPAIEEKITEKENLVYESWKKCLDQLSSLNHITGLISRGAAIDILSSIAETFLFPEKNRDHFIQVIQLSEAAGMSFDYTWVMGCHSEALPPSPEPNSFIPSALRRKHQLPRCNSKWELENCEILLQEILQFSDEIIFSYPSQDGETDLEPSTLLKAFPQAEGLVLPSSKVKDQICNFTALESFEEEPFLHLSEDEKHRFELGEKSGGTNLLKLQANCPFSAFTRYRLHARDNDIPDTDFDPLLRGQLIHRILEIFWIKTKTKNRLEKLYKSEQLEREIQKCVHQAAQELSENLSEQPEFIKMEESRSLTLVKEWLISFDMLRDDFTVLKSEENKTARIKTLTLNLQIDRIDQTQNNKQVLIDYKTGEAKTSEWLGERVLSPQLPLYSTHLSPSAVAFAQIKRGSMRFRGVKDPSFIFPGLKVIPYQKIVESTEWSDLQDFWKEKIETLVDEFLQGFISIDPAQKKTTCQNCNFESFCRIGTIEVDEP